MKKVFDPIKAEVDQYAVDKKCDETERKNLLIENENLIVDCLSKDVYTTTNFMLTVSRFFDMHDAYTAAQKRITELEAKNSNMKNKIQNDDHDEMIKHFSKLEIADSQITKLTEQVTNLQAQNNLFRAKNDKIKQHYKELYDSIKITRAKHIEQVKPKVLARGKHAIDVEPIVPRLRNNRDAHLDYLRPLKESVETIHDIVKEAKVVRPLDRSIVSVCRYTKNSQELLEYGIDTCPQGSQK
nr:hypothetical protein [Tanacetum cinerariifolium]